MYCDRGRNQLPVARLVEVKFLLEPHQDNDYVFFTLKYVEQMISLYEQTGKYYIEHSK